MGARLCLLLLVFASDARAQDWPQWRGPARDGQVTSFTAPATWPAQLISSWKKAVGSGYASPVVSGGRVYVFARESDREVVRAFDLESGEDLWRDSYPARYAALAEAAAHGSGPKATPIVARGRLWTVGVSGVI